MACFSPLLAWQLDGGEIVFKERGKIRRELKLPCGQCVGCRLERSRQWAMRCVHEASMYENNCFVTLTYDDYHVPHDWSLDYRDFQLFMKRLRKTHAGVRFYMCGEYGEQYGRPHFHAALFNCDFGDRRIYKDMPSGSRLYTSETLDKIWQKGFTSIGDVTFESAAYIARYVMKKITGSQAEQHYEMVDGATGEIYSRVPEFNRMSLKPGIGATFYRQFAADMYPRDYVVLRGMKMKPPRYYDNLLEAEPSYMSDEVFEARLMEIGKFAEDRTEERLSVRETVAKARLNFKKRVLV